MLLLQNGLSMIVNSHNYVHVDVNVAVFDDLVVVVLVVVNDVVVMLVHVVDALFSIYEHIK